MKTDDLIFPLVRHLEFFGNVWSWKRFRKIVFDAMRLQRRVPSMDMTSCLRLSQQMYDAPRDPFRVKEQRKTRLKGTKL